MIRVRFAPSPTGSLHIGSVRTTLYNYFFARQNKGALVLRVEDTDQDRLVPGAIDTIYDGLRWIGIRWDEGPREGGPHAPYVQSERLPLYQEHARRLVAQGHGYYCFCTKERLAAVRQQQQARGDVTRYDRHCRWIEPALAAERAAREPHVVRLKIPEEGTIVIEDLVHGRVEWPLASLEDHVLLKSDGFPTYHLAVVVDDHLMEISHVFRADDWLPSTPKHVLLYRAFGWEVPPFAHLPNVLGPDGRKLSKRHGATAVSEFRDAGYLPEAVVNFLALIGWSPGTEQEIFSLEELIARWRIEQVQAAGGRWDRERLNWFNGTWIRRLSHDELAPRLRAFLPADWDERRVRAAVPLVQERIQTLADAKPLIEFLFTDALEYDATAFKRARHEPGDVAEALARASVVLRHAEPFDGPVLEQALRAVAADVGWKAGDLFMAIRIAVTGRTETPPLMESLVLLGRERALDRVEAAQEKLGA